MPLPGGAQAIREPWRSAYAQIRAALGWSGSPTNFAGSELCADLGRRPLATLDAMLAKGLNCLLTSSCGRLFDAVAAALGICRERASYEGQAAIELEALSTTRRWTPRRTAIPSRSWSSRIARCSMARRSGPRFCAISARATPRGVIAARFHLGLARAIVDVVDRLRSAAAGERFATVALSGGVFQNRILFEQVSAGLRERRT